ncbi:RNA-binding protein 25-like [Temnothorax curvispinosus]|uniref:RNA-binding protein 25-like n=1 Tax=Temnothorax curvispinosus TaxID=300111 RepID=A0A6J1RAV4_9HYME|nr:RNA-binding protein 25-like [Temnothorax curvispinosus]
MTIKKPRQINAGMPLLGTDKSTKLEVTFRGFRTRCLFTDPTSLPRSLCRALVPPKGRAESIPKTSSVAMTSATFPLVPESLKSRATYLPARGDATDVGALPREKTHFSGEPQESREEKGKESEKDEEKRGRYASDKRTTAREAREREEDEEQEDEKDEEDEEERQRREPRVRTEEASP